MVLLRRFRILLMGLPHHIFMTDLSTGDWIPPTPRRSAPISEPHHYTF